MRADNLATSERASAGGAGAGSAGAGREGVSAPVCQSAPLTCFRASWEKKLSERRRQLRRLTRARLPWKHDNSRAWRWRAGGRLRRRLLHVFSSPASRRRRRRLGLGSPVRRRALDNRTGVIDWTALRRNQRRTEAAVGRGGGGRESGERLRWHWRGWQQITFVIIRSSS